jgi:hypothetical protein
MSATNPTEALLRAQVAVDQIRLSRLATQNAIQRSRASLAQTRSALAALRRFYSAALRQKMQRRINDIGFREAS